MRTIYAADLFCGMGGTSFGLYEAADDLGLSVDLLAVNHWKVAIATHTQNHKLARHLCETLDGVNPRKVVPSGRLRLLVASPECTHHSNARGGRPMSDQSRASAWHVIRWAEALRIDDILVENVKEFLSWGPIGADGRPLKSQKGKTFDAFIKALESLNYRVEWRVLCSADYGDPTERYRLFVRARLKRRAIKWPEPTHTESPGTDLFNLSPGWRNFRNDVWDRSRVGKSIFLRNKPLARATLRRAFRGLIDNAAPEIQPLLLRLYRPALRGQRPSFWPASVEVASGPAVIIGQQSGGAARGVDQPIPTVAGKGAIAIAESVILPNATAAARSSDRPVSTIHGAGSLGLVEPTLVPFFGERDGQAPRHHSVDGPVPAVTSHGAGGLVEPRIVEFHGGEGSERRTCSVDAPLPTQTCDPRFALAEPALIEVNHTGERAPLDTEAPMPTLSCKNGFGVAEPVIVTSGGPERDARSADRPIGTVLGKEHHAVVDPHLLTYHSNGGVRSVDQPVPTITSRDRAAVIELLKAGKLVLDIRFRMLTTRELARAQGFPDTFEITGTRADQVKQIGNAVPGGLAKALCKAALE